MPQSTTRTRNLLFSIASDNRRTMPIRVWPDGTIALLEDMQEGDYDYMSDDYRDIDGRNASEIKTFDEKLQGEILCFVIDHM